MHYLVLIWFCACGAASESAPAPTPTSSRPAHGPSCSNLATVPTPLWAGWQTSGATDPCTRLTRCARAGCAETTCLHAYYGCTDSGTLAKMQEEKLGAAYFISVACCPN